ncbi:MAG: ABC transporter ATP-binding protein [Candidatus Hodarchaeota archaeon]
MEKPVIEINNISKMYNIVQREDTLLESITNFFKKKPKTQAFWALKNITIDVYKEERIGIIGRNGAGKTTLLKILSRITPPTSGKIKIKGKVASLLQVGTGFHPELTGHENIYLNGSILGMKRREIDRKYKEILEFAGIRQFIHTPVKRYSSGMFVRLAFSVAAHLEPEILLIDEVLAVGDAQFQQKCLGKMKEVTQEGRTILFVSHNMAAISNLCHKVVLIDNGRTIEIGEPNLVIAHYLESFREQEHLRLSDRTDRTLKGDVKLTDIRIYDTKTQMQVETLISGQDIQIEVAYESISSHQKLKNVSLGLSFFTYHGQFMFRLNSQQASKAFTSLPLKGCVFCHIPKFPLMPGNYYIRARLKINREDSDLIENAKSIEVQDGDFFETGLARSWGRSAGVYVPHSWNTKLSETTKTK